MASKDEDVSSSSEEDSQDEHEDGESGDDGEDEQEVRVGAPWAHTRSSMWTLMQ